MHTEDVLVHCRFEELSKTLSQQYNVAAELRRNLEAEAALHTNNVSCALPIQSAAEKSDCFVLHCKCCFWLHIFCVHPADCVFASLMQAHALSAWKSLHSQQVGSSLASEEY